MAKKRLSVPSTCDEIKGLRWYTPSRTHFKARGGTISRKMSNPMAGEDNDVEGLRTSGKVYVSSEELINALYEVTKLMGSKLGDEAEYAGAAEYTQIHHDDLVNERHIKL